MQKLTKEQMLTQLMIKLDQIEYKLDKVLSLNPQIQSVVTGNAFLVHGNSDGKPPRWNNESCIDYMKRIGELNTPQSDEESFREEMK